MHDINISKTSNGYLCLPFPLYIKPAVLLLWLSSLNSPVHSPLSIWLSATYMFISVSLFNVSDILDWSSAFQPRWTGSEEDGVLGESTAVRNLMPSAAVMPDTQCASHFVRSVAELWARVCRYLFPSSPATWPGLKALHMQLHCACALRCDQQH